jgi:hypothetical protein
MFGDHGTGLERRVIGGSVEVGFEEVEGGGLRDWAGCEYCRWWHGCGIGV